MHDSTAYTPPATRSAPKSFLRRITLSQWIIISMVVGILVGWLFPDPRATSIAAGRRRT